VLAATLVRKIPCIGGKTAQRTEQKQ